MRRPWQADVAVGRIQSRQLRIAIRRHSNGAVGLIVKRVREWQRDRGGAVVAVIANVCRARNDATADLDYVVMVLRRATGNGIVA